MPPSNVHETECVLIDVNVFPTSPSPPPKPKQVIPEKLLQIMKKYKYNWRLEQLALPKRRNVKFAPEVVEPLKIEKVQPPKLSPEIKFYADQMSRPLLRNVVLNKRLFGKQNGKKYVQSINRNIFKAWDSIYNYYKKKERDKRRRQQKRDEKMKKAIKKTIDTKRFDALAVPKKVPVPEPIPKPTKIFEDFDHLDVLAAPKHYIEQPPKPQGVSPAALTYEITERVLKMAEIPARFKNQPKPLEPGKVQTSALRYKITPTIEKLAIPKKRSEKAKDDEEIDPFAISKNALKYKATPRIIELAKPMERE